MVLFSFHTHKLYFHRCYDLHDGSLIWLVLFIVTFGLLNSYLIMQFFSFNEDLSLRQPETMAVMTWLRDIRFTASATLHGVIFL